MVVPLTYEYIKPKSKDEAVSAITSAKNPAILAGGTDLFLEIKRRQLAPDWLIDLSDAHDLAGISRQEGHLRIGAMTSFMEISESGIVKELFPSLSAAALSVGSPQIRTMATMGGNVANGAAAADSIPVLLSLSAKAVVADSEGERTIPVEELELKKGQLITEFLISIKPGFYAFDKIGRRKSLAIARLNLGVYLNFDGNVVSDAAIAFGAVGKKAYRSAVTEAAIIGRPLDEAVIKAACETAGEVVRVTLGDRPTATYKSLIAQASLRRTLSALSTSMSREV